MAYTKTELEITVDWLKEMLREKSSVADTEIRDLIESCVLELKIAGVQGKLTDPLYRQAVKLYAKAHFGYDSDSERFLKAFQNLRDSMALSGEYGGGASGL